MDLSIKWLNDYVKLDGISAEKFAEEMTMSGSKVERLNNLSELISNVVVAEVTSIEKHADSDKLWITQLDCGDKGTVQIVTAAQNVFKGAYVPVVLDGGTVVRDKAAFKIKSGKLRGVASQGMMCSFEELGMEQYDFPYAIKDGILILNDDPDFSKIRKGMNICEFVGLDDTVVEFEITNNRPDCLSVIGLAREAAATFNLPFDPPKPTFNGTDGEPNLSVSVDTKNCSRYMAAVVKNVQIKPSPRFITERLRASGVRAVSNIVDITNYVMLEYGHPMHAFDKRYVVGDKIVVRQANDGEQITLLDGETRTLDNTVTVIADSEKPIAVAGVMGGEYSGVMADTKDVVFEAACFDGVAVRRAAVKIGRRTESSGRFEKGIDPINAADALFRALELVEQLGCGEVVRSVIDVDHTNKEPARVRFDPTHINKLLGADIPADKQADILKRLGFTFDGDFALPPHIRVDIHIEEDLAEEVARIYGYNNIASTVPRLPSAGAVTPAQRAKRFLERVMVGLGFSQTVTMSFVSPTLHKKSLIESGGAVIISNPLGDDTSVMRLSLLPSLIDVAVKNKRAGNRAARLFELGRSYRYTTDKLPTETDLLGALLYGENEDFFSLKGAVEAVLSAFGVNAVVKAQSECAAFHPGRSAKVTVGDETLGIFGELHPTVTENFGIKDRVYAAEIDTAKLFAVSPNERKYAKLPRFPALTRDISLVCPEEAENGTIITEIEGAAKNLESVELFDVFRGGGLETGKKAYAYKLTFRGRDGTLTDEAADKAVGKILASLETQGITLRT
ncbi:MAG: phenylalanine--tRNA ligase subunit beta [Oscillospiraceae bacterium]|jgi:phenylalanyl-tRNA synthetase beta chain|nr:phenylalanine--tRNA ligase subunit beta [Oscillospiraceae bacterium]